jgi:hypothetical protein
VGIRGPDNREAFFDGIDPKRPRDRTGVHC